jgi:hypothetical protein
MKGGGLVEGLDPLDGYTPRATSLCASTAFRFRPALSVAQPRGICSAPRDEVEPNRFVPTTTYSTFELENAPSELLRSRLRPASLRPGGAHRPVQQASRCPMPRARDLREVPHPLQFQRVMTSTDDHALRALARYALVEGGIHRRIRGPPLHPAAALFEDRLVS